MLAKIGVAVLVIAVVLFIVISTRPDTFRIARSTIIAAPAEVVFAQLNDFRRWARWNPFEKPDPAMRKTYAGAPAGVGATFHYVSDKVGEGRMTLIESRPYERVAIRAEFIKPMAATNTIEFTLTPVPEGVSATWAMSGDQTFLGKAISLFVNMDRMVGTQFEQGLAELKEVSEAEATRHADDGKPAVAAAPETGEGL